MRMINLRKMIIFIVSTIGLLIIDQLTKIAAVTALKGKSPFVLIKNVLEFSYLQNDGAAWGMMSGGRIFFITITPIIVLVLIFIIYRIPYKKKYIPLFVVITVLTAGALGNYIDRLLHGYVHDFIYFKLIDFPIFNVADIYLVVSCIAFAILFLFVYKEDEDFAFLKLRIKKTDRLKEIDNKNG